MIYMICLFYQALLFMHHGRMLEAHTAYLNDDSHPVNFYTIINSITPTTFVTDITKRTSFTGITVRNNKCFCYPYNYLLVSNNNGSNNIYRYEDFSTTNCQFENQLALTIGCSGRIVPTYYKGMLYNEDEALALGKYPTCAWSSDAFTNWLTQNSVNIPVGIGLIGAGLAITAVTGGAGAGAGGAVVSSGISATFGSTLAISGASLVASGIGSFKESKLAPNISGGQATGDVVWSADRMTFVYHQMRCKNEYMRIIDDYFTKFGYAIKHLDSPNLTGRTNWNYIQIGATDEIGYGDVPTKFMDIINKACRKGVTIWHSHANLGNYSLTNSIVT